MLPLIQVFLLQRCQRGASVVLTSIQAAYSAHATCGFSEALSKVALVPATNRHMILNARAFPGEVRDPRRGSLVSQSRRLVRFPRGYPQLSGLLSCFTLSRSPGSARGGFPAPPTVMNFSVFFLDSLAS